MRKRSREKGLDYRVLAIGVKKNLVWQRARRLVVCGCILSHSPDCLHCGVCCFSQLDAYVRVTGADWERLGVEASRTAHFIGHRAYMKMTDGHCAALQLRRTREGGTEFFCAVYAERPQVCRDLARGSPECEGELATKAERAARGGA